jgi:hypothetical protein
LQKKLEERIEHLLQDVATQAHEITRLQVFETELKAEKDKVAAARIQVHSLQEFSIRLHTSAYVSIRRQPVSRCTRDRNLASVSIRQHTSAYVRIRRQPVSRCTRDRTSIYIIYIYIYTYTYVYLYTCIYILIFGGSYTGAVVAGHRRRTPGASLLALLVILRALQVQKYKC